ncbi:hypothetical protein ACHAXT_003562 [Thalassiosira profunda]
MESTRAPEEKTAKEEGAVAAEKMDAGPAVAGGGGSGGPEAGGEKEAKEAEGAEEGVSLDASEIMEKEAERPPKEAAAKAVVADEKGAEDEAVAADVQPIAGTEEEGDEESLVAAKVQNVKRTAVALAEKRRGEALDGALEALQESVAAAIRAHQEREAGGKRSHGGERRGANDAYARLRDASAAAYKALVVYGGAGKEQREGLRQIGGEIWMSLRDNAELFHEAIGEDPAGGEDDPASFGGRKGRAIAGGYVRAIAARLVLADYIDARGGAGRPPVLTPAGSDGASASQEELAWGVKLFARAGRMLLAHGKDARAAYDALSLAGPCFEAIAGMASQGSGSAKDKLKSNFDEAFDAVAMLPNAASLFGEAEGAGAPDGISWQKLVIECLEKAESFVDTHCNVFKAGEESWSTSKLAALQRFLPSLARLCYKHGSHFVKLRDHDNASKALRIALKSTDCCLEEIRKELKQGTSRKAKAQQMMHNLEAELVVVSIEAFNLLAVSYQDAGDKEKALLCLDKVEIYMSEQYDRDNELYSAVTNRLNGADFVFSEGGATSALEGDKADIKKRSERARDDATNRHAAEKATLAFSRIQIYHRTAPAPSPEDESLIDKKTRELIELATKFASASGSASIQHAVAATSVDSKEKTFDLTLQTIRVVHARRAVAKVSGDAAYTDNYKVLLDKLPENHFRRPLVLLDKLNALLSAEHQVRGRAIEEKDAGRLRQLDNESLQTAKEFLEAVAKAKGDRDADTTLFAASTESLSDELFEQSKVHFARAVSLYHSLDAHELCAQWTDLLEGLLKSQSGLSLGDADKLLGEVMAIKAHALSMSGNHASGMKVAREAWTKVKSVDSLVTLFHASLRYQLKHHSCDTMLEFDGALAELLALSDSDEVLAAFPRLTNSCRVADRDVSIEPEFSLFAILRPYLDNFEHVLSLKDSGASDRNFEKLMSIVDGVLKLMVMVREMNAPAKKKKSRRKKAKKSDDADAATTDAEKGGFVLVWDDPATTKLVGDKTDCVWTAEQLWNIANQLMAADKKGVAADVFAASHDFCLMSEEEVGQSLSKGYLDFDLKFDPTRTLLPTFGGPSGRKPCDISSEFSGQCLVVSVAAAADYANSRLHGNSNGVATVDNDVQILLSRSLSRLAQAKEEMHLNCDDTQQLQEHDRTCALLTLRLMIGVGDDDLAEENLKSLSEELLKSHLEELSAFENADNKSEAATQLQTLLQTKLMSDSAVERNMPQTARCLQRLCAKQLIHMDKFQLDIGDLTISLGEIQKKTIQSSSSIQEVLEVYAEIGKLIEKHQKEGKEGGIGYSSDDLVWLCTNASNQATDLELLSDYRAAASLLEHALNLRPLCGTKLQCHAQAMQSAYQQVISRSRTDSLSSIWNLISG